MGTPRKTKPRRFETMALLPPVPAGSLRRAVLFLVAIGLPLSAGVFLEQPAGALLGAVCGLLFSFADDNGAVGKRFTILFMAAGAIALGGFAGLWLRGFPPSVFVLFAALVFATGMLNAVGKAPNMSARLGAMALLVTSGIPQFQFAEIFYPLAALGVVTLARSLDHLAFGPLPQQRAGPRNPPAGGWIRYAAAYAASATVSLWIGVTIDPGRVLWVVVTTLFVMQPDARASYVRIVERIVGTVVGVMAAYAVTSLLHTPWSVTAAVLLVSPLIPHHLQTRYWLHTALIALLVLLVYDLAAFDPRILRGLFTERLEDVLLGAGIALIGTAVAFPRKAPEQE